MAKLCGRDLELNGNHVPAFAGAGLQPGRYPQQIIRALVPEGMRV